MEFAVDKCHVTEMADDDYRLCMKILKKNIKESQGPGSYQRQKTVTGKPHELMNNSYVSITIFKITFRHLDVDMQKKNVVQNIGSSSNGF